MRKSAIILSAALVLIGGTGAVGASATTAERAKPKSYGFCVNAKGAVRMLEPLSLRRSAYGACKAGERKIHLPTKHAIPVIPPAPATVVYKRGSSVETCTKTADAVLTYVCVTAPTPSPSPAP